MTANADRPLYVATFDGFTDDWSLSQGRLKSDILPDGVLQIEVGDSNSLPFAQSSPYFDNFVVRVQTVATKGPENNGFGLIFRLQTKDNSTPDDDDFYFFEISTDGYYRVLRSLGGVQKELSTWIPSPAINTALGAINWLEVSATKNEFQFFVNNQLMKLCIPDDPEGISTFPASGECVGGQMLDVLTDSTISNGQLGVAAQAFDEPGVVVEFDNLVVYSPK